MKKTIAALFLSFLLCFSEIAAVYAAAPENEKIVTEEEQTELPDESFAEEKVNAGEHVSHCFCGGNCAAAVSGAGASKHTCVDPSNITWEAISGTWKPVIEKNTTHYYYLSDAVTFSATFSLEANQKVYLCLNGKTISSEKRIFQTGYKGNGAELYICDCQGTGKVKLTKTDYSGHSPILQFVGTYSARVDIFGGTFSGNVATYTSTVTGGQIRIEKGELNIFGGAFNPNPGVTVAKTTSGGSIYMGTGGALNMYGGTFSGFSGDIYGTIYVKGAMNMYGGIIQSNTSTNTNGGGGVAVDGGTLTMNGGKISGCVTNGGNGGNIYSTSTGTLILQGGEIVGGEIIDPDKKKNGGGNIYSNGNITIKDNVIIANGEANNRVGGNVLIGGNPSEKPLCFPAERLPEEAERGEEIFISIRTILIR